MVHFDRRFEFDPEPEPERNREDEAILPEFRPLVEESRELAAQLAWQAAALEAQTEEIERHNREMEAIEAARLERDAEIAEIQYQQIKAQFEAMPTPAAAATALVIFGIVFTLFLLVVTS